MESERAGVSKRESGLPIWKRALDWTVILVMAPGVLLVGAAVALIVRFGSSGPILFKQRRVGHLGREFMCFKFRTMRTGAETQSHQQYTSDLIKSKAPMIKLDAKNDPRLVPFGSLLRSTGLDELPQLFNVLRGEMSLVGPRPCIPYEAESYEPWHRRRFEAVPGLTGLWQVSGKNRTTFDQMVMLDIKYAETRSLWLDLRIMLKTAPVLWRQFCEMRARKRQAATVTNVDLSNSLESNNV